MARIDGNFDTAQRELIVRTKILCLSPIARNRLTRCGTRGESQDEQVRNVFLNKRPRCFEFDPLPSGSIRGVNGVEQIDERLMRHCFLESIELIPIWSLREWRQSLRETAD